MKKPFFIKTILSVSILLLVFSIAYSQECETSFDFNNWTMEGTPDAYWKILDTNDVIDTTGIFPATFFVSQNDVINVKIRGTISVETNYDDDFIGIVFNYHKPTQLADDNPYKFFLFDWKAKEESTQGYLANEGFRLSRYDGFISRNNQKKYFWGNAEETPIRTILNKRFGDTLGWKPFRDYQIELIYTSNHIRISIDNKIIFNCAGCFKAGKFGFYGLSQGYTRFRDFTYQNFIDFIPEPGSACIGDSIWFYPYNPECCPVVPGFIELLEWDFGDGETSTEIIPSHLYTNTGEYDVVLIVSKTDGCIDTITNKVTVKPLPNVNLGDDVELPACSPITLDADNPGLSYLWSTGETTQTIELFVLSEDTTVWVVVDENGCLASNSIFIDVVVVHKKLHFPNAFTPNGDGKNDFFAPVGFIDDVSLYQLLIYNKWGQLLFESNDPNSGWDGKCNGRISPTGVYVYKVDYSIERS
ncbi:MAG: gliding motility-associated C-terminal domain-containing protein, partial [Bacteroidales bacterium]|nr:gliding motility-associated C-terminal domain-containing protein [Bacteroidales bacterium]